MLADREVRISHALTVQRMEEFLSNVDDLTLADYLDWKEFTSQVYGLKGRNRADDCVTLTANMFHDIAGKRYLERHFNFDSIATVKQLVDDVKGAFLEMLSENDWMDYKTKRRAELKLDFNEQNTYYEIVMAAEYWMQDRAFQKLDKLNTRDKFDVSVSEVNAFYDGSQNLIAIMAGMLQPPFFNVSLPRILNYGALGVVAGHEITHGFDDIGASYDELGNKNNWWDDRTYRNFEWKKQCFDVQYGSIIVKDVHVAIDGKRTEGENIADNGGMRAAARVAARLAARPSEQFIIAGLEDYTTLQYFFMHYAYIWCGSTRRATLLNKLATDVHPPDMYRVNVVLSNQPEFGKAFGCQKGSPMYPEQTCTLW
ncbi:hypothetical protein OESDEN_01709 [Oesophagostomum dentatum]|uniref:Peptidase family M13 n=1 Tax=Oesophagostomum dentatum TaxID=61180 RepID=A0A0B1TQB9_OESDE|nr:hypothetical protein OESDEN_01709 [Oesophagostomum dentatum]